MLIEIPELTTARLLLRGFRHEDLDAYAEMVADPEVMQFIGDGQILDRKQAWRNMAMVTGHWQLRGYGLWAVEEQSTSAMIGRIGLWNPEGWPQMEVGWTLRRAYWGQGFAVEAAQASIDYAVTVLKEHHLISLIKPANQASIRVAERLGEELEGTLELHRETVLVYGMTVRGCLKRWNSGKKALRL
jgi:RimJ/RimL family protein N-acetyltransferase